MQKKKKQSFSWLIAPLFFLIFAAPGALDYVFHFPDEKYYTDAVLQMMDKSDYFTPYSADGSPRFLKPIITYWVLIASYKVMGVSPVSSRIFFWLAGAVLVSLVFFMAKSLTRNRRLALTAAFITAASPLVLMSASRSIPDILLALFLTISAWGFLEILRSDHPVPKFYWMAWLGGALAFETKGLPAAAFAGISILFLLLNPWKRKKIRQLIHPGAIILSAAVALSWFVVMYVEHGNTYLASFFSDQVGDRVTSGVVRILNNTLLGMVSLLAFTFPWIIIAFSRPAKVKRAVEETTSETKAVLGFIGTWVVAVIIMSGAVFKFYDRYLLPVIPLVSLFFAWTVFNSGTRFSRKFFNLFLGLNLFTITLNILYAVFIRPQWVLVTGTAFSTVLILLYFSGFFNKRNSRENDFSRHFSDGSISGMTKRAVHRIPVSTENLLANAIMMLYFNGFLLLYGFMMPNMGEQLVKSLRSENISEKQEVWVYGNIRTASNIRIQSHHEFNVVSMDTAYTLPAVRGPVLVFRENKKKRFNLHGYTLKKGSEEWSAVPVKKFPAFLQEPVRSLKENGKKYVIALPIPKK